MYFRQSLKRPRQQFQKMNDNVKTQQFMKESIRQIKEAQSRRIDTGLLQQIDQDFFVTPPEVACSPLLSKTLLYPQVAQQLRVCAANQRDIGYYGNVFWIYANEKLVLWTFDRKSEIANYPPVLNQQDWNFSFEQDIMCVAMGNTNGFLFNGRSDLKILAVALLSCIKLYTFDGNFFESLRIRFTVGQQVQRILITEQGDIFYVGSNGSVQQLKSFKKNMSISFQLRQSISFKNKVFQALNFFQPTISAKQLIINNEGTILYFLAQYRYQDSWLWKRFSSAYPLCESKIIIYSVTANGIQINHQIAQRRLFQKLTFSNPLLFDNKTSEIMGISLTKRGMLGLTFKNGVFVVIRNTIALQFYSINIPPQIPNKMLSIHQRVMPSSMNITEVKSTLGLYNLTCFNRIIAYYDPKSFDFYLKDTREQGKLFEWSRMDILKRLNGTIFQEQPEWIYMHNIGIDLIKKYRNVDKILIYINICLSLKNNNKVQVNLKKILQDFSSTIGVVPFCTCLIEIICNLDLEAETIQQTYQSTMCSLLEIQFQIEKYDKRQSFLKKIIKISNSFESIQYAKRILNSFQSLPVKSIKTPESNVFLQNLSIRNPPLADALWYSLIYYFNSLFGLIKDQQTSFFQKQTGFVKFVSRKLQIFNDFMLEKMKFCSEFTRNFQLTSSEKVTLPELMQIQSVGKEVDNRKIEIQRKQGNDFPLNITPTLIKKMVKLVQQVILIIDLMSKIGYFQPDLIKEPTPYRLLTDSQSRSIMRNRIFSTFPISDPYLTEIEKVLPQLISKDHKTFELWLKGDNKNKIELSTVIGILDLPKLRKIKETYYKLGFYRQYFELSIKRLEHLQRQKRALDELYKQNLQMRQQDSVGSQGFFEKSETEEFDKKRNSNAVIYSEQLANFLQEFEALLEAIRSRGFAEDFKRLQQAVSAIYNCQEISILSRCIELLQKYMMIPQVRILRAHPVVKLYDAELASMSNSIR